MFPHAVDRAGPFRAAGNSPILRQIQSVGQNPSHRKAIVNRTTASTESPERARTTGGWRDRLMPTRVTRWTRFLAWLSVAVHVGIVTTGGLVRLTGSGLGCPTWPMCTEDSLVPTPEMGVHGIIEFGNRTLTGVVCVVALLMFLAVVRTPKPLRLAAPALWIGILTIVQAVVGGITVLLDLHPNAVGVHFLISGLLVTIATVLLVRVVRDEPLPVRTTPVGLVGDGLVMTVAWVTLVWTWVTVYVGSLTTGSGPHAGDVAAERNGLDSQIMQHVHSIPAYVLLACSVALVALAAWRRMRGATGAAAGLLALVVLQAVIGVWQSRTGLPVPLVSVHMTLSVIAIAFMTATFVLVRRACSRGAIEGGDPVDADAPSKPVVAA